MTFHYNFISFVDLLAYVQGMITGFVLIINHNKFRPTAYLGLFLITYASELLISFLSHTLIEKQYPSLYFLPFRFYLINAPFFYFYVKNLTGSFRRSADKAHMIPGMLEFVLWSSLFILSFYDTRIRTWIPLFNEYYYLYHLAAICFSLVYAGLSLGLIFKHQKTNPDLPSNLQKNRLKWVKWVACFIISYHLLCMVPLLVSGEFHNNYLQAIFSVINLIFIYWVGISGIRQPKLEAETNREKIPDLKHLPDDSRFIHLTSIILEKELYKDPSLTLISLAEEAGMSRNEISHLINKNAHSNFNVFINTYRVQEAKRLLKDPSYNNLNMLGIAQESGFNSKATFFAVFKQHIGQSPGTFKNNDAEIRPE